VFYIGVSKTGAGTGPQHPKYRGAVLDRPGSPAALLGPHFTSVLLFHPPNLLDFYPQFNLYSVIRIVFKNCGSLVWYQFDFTVSKMESLLTFVEFHTFRQL
jgi:hypothetical protein